MALGIVNPCLKGSSERKPPQPAKRSGDHLALSLARQVSTRPSFKSAREQAIALLGRDVRGNIPQAPSLINLRVPPVERAREKQASLPLCNAICEHTGAICVVYAPVPAIPRAENERLTHAPS